MKRLCLGLLLFVTTLASSPLHGLFGIYPVGYGTPARGIAGAAIAFPQDSLVIATNPAGIGFLSNRADAGALALWLKGNSKINTEPYLDSRECRIFPEIGGVMTVYPQRCCPLEVGIALYRKGLLDMRLSQDILLFGQTPIRSLFDVVCLSPAVATTFKACFGCHSVGAALNISRGLANFQGMENLSVLSEDPNHFSNMGGDVRYGTSVSIGILSQFFNLFSIGAVYQSPTWFPRFTKYRGLIPNGGDLNLPATFGFGFANYLTAEWTFTLDILWNMWSFQKGWGNDAGFTPEWGSRNGPGFGWDSQFVYKLGAQYCACGFVKVRAGYAFGRCPPNGRDALANIRTLTVSEHHLTAGATIDWRCNSFSIAYAHAFHNRVSGDVPNAIPTLFMIADSQQSELSLSYARRF